MRCLDRNRRDVWYANPVGEPEEVISPDGTYTGETEVRYSRPVLIRMNVSAEKGGLQIAGGKAVIQDYGIEALYDRVMVTDDTDCPITEQSRLWFGVSPREAPHNYTVLRKSESINFISYAIKRVEASDGRHPYTDRQAFP